MDIQRQFVATLTSEIGMLDAVLFEKLCHHLICAIEKDQSLIYRGSNFDGKPVGYTVDSFSFGGKLTGEYSTDKAYFKSPYTKPAHDTNHALGRASGPIEKLYLLSNQVCPNGHFPDVEAAVKNADPDCRICEPIIFDARKIAEEIVRLIPEKSLLADVVFECLPQSKNLYLYYEYSHAMPGVPYDYIFDEREDSLIDKIKNNPITVITGISGIGKSYLARSVAEKLEGFDNRLWLFQDDMDKNVQFQSFPVKRLAASLNIANLFNKTKTLLIIDGWNQRLDLQLFSELKAGFEIGSKIVITSQIRPQPELGLFSVNSTPERLAYKILTRDVSTPASSEEHVQTIIKTSGGHPLLMSIVNGMLRHGEGDFKALSEDSAFWPQYEDSDNVELCILQRILPKAGIEGELAIFKWLDLQSVDKELAKTLCGIGPLQKLINRNFFQEERNEILYFHDLIFAFLRSSALSGEDPTEKFLSFFSSHLNVADYHFQRSVQMASTRIRELCENQKTVPDLVHYLYLLAKNNKLNPEKVLQLCKYDLRIHPNDRIAIECILEAREVIRYCSSYPVEIDKNFDCDTIAQIDSMLPNIPESETLRHVLLHHKGKALKRQGRSTEALEAFNQAYVTDNAPETALQLARLHTDKDVKRMLYMDIMQRFIANPAGIAITVVLAAFSEGASRLSAEDLEDPTLQDAFILAIQMSNAEGFLQTFQAIDGFGGRLWYTHPEVLIKIEISLQLPGQQKLGEQDKFTIAQALKTIAKAHNETGSSQKAEAFLSRASEYYEALSTTKKEFYLTHIAEFWLLKNMPEEAIKLLSGFLSEGKKDCQPHFYHRYAQALFQVGELEEALSQIEIALSLNKNQRFQSAFLETRANIFMSMKRLEEARSSLGEAIMLTEGKYKQQLCKKLASF